MSTVVVNSSSCQSYLKPGRCLASRQLSELTTVAFRATKILSAVEVDIPIDSSFQNYQNSNNSGSSHSCRPCLSELSKSCQ